MKLLTFIGCFIFITIISSAQVAPPDKIIYGSIPILKVDSGIEKRTMIEQQALFRGGDWGFYKFIEKNVKKPELATLFGFKGHILIAFTLSTTGTVKDIKALSDCGLGYEEEVIAVIERAPAWKPATQNDIPVEQKLTVPFTLDFSRKKINTDELKHSSYTFTFKIKDKVYSSEQAEAILGNSFNSNLIDYPKSFAEQPEGNKKQKAYLIQIID